MMTPDQLAENHWRMLTEDSGIAPEVIQARGYRTETVKAQLMRLGFSQSQALTPTLLLPVHDVWGSLSLYQARPDQPRIGKNGKPIKYETMAESRMHIDVHPFARAALADPAIPLFITEGIKKGDCLVTCGRCAIALLGVWNWRGRNEHDGKTALPDWEGVALNGREVFVVFDSDVMVKAEVHRALGRFGQFLHARDALVNYVYLPSGVDGTKVGVDDFLVAGNSIDSLFDHASRELKAIENSDRDAPYITTPGGLVWLKPTRNGEVPTPLTNFDARIVADINEDDGVERRRLLELEANLAGRRTTFTVSASQFTAMNWPIEHLGASAVVFPGSTTRDHARTAIQTLSTEVEERTVYAHLGWRKIEGEWIFLHAGGGIGANGPRPNVEVRLPAQLEDFTSTLPESDEVLRENVRASLELRLVGPQTLTLPLLASTYRAALGSVDSATHIAGPTGAGKTVIAALAQQHFGARMNGRRLPASWLSTGNSLETLAFLAKDVLLTVDDFAPGGGASNVERQHREADRLLRAQGNRAGRQRLGADAGLRPARAPRGSILSTGEDVPRGQSLRARMLILEVGRDDLDWPLITKAQGRAASGDYACAYAGFVRWLAGRYTDITESMPRDLTALRQAATTSAAHRRTPDIVASLALGFQYFLTFAVEVGAIPTVEEAELKEACWRALGSAAALQAEHQTDAEPASQFLVLLRSAIVRGGAHLCTPDGNAPSMARLCGWRDAGDRLLALGDCVGWLEGDEVYLDPTAAYAASQKLGREIGEQLSVQPRTLHKRLMERGFLASVDVVRGTNTIRRTLQGTRRDVLHLKVGLLLPEPDQSDQPDLNPREELPPDSEGEPPGQFLWSVSERAVTETAQEIGQFTDQPDSEDMAPGQFGQNGHFSTTQPALGFSGVECTPEDSLTVFRLAESYAFPSVRISSAETVLPGREAWERFTERAQAEKLWTARSALESLASATNGAAE